MKKLNNIFESYQANAGFIWMVPNVLEDAYGLETMGYDN